MSSARRSSVRTTGFNYSSAFQDKGKEGFTWTFEHLDAFLTDPRTDIPGTAMSFAGIKKPDERADVIAYLRTLSDNPVPLPAAPAPAPADGRCERRQRRRPPTTAAGAAPAAGGSATAVSFVDMVKNADVKKGEAAPQVHGLPQPAEGPAATRSAPTSTASSARRSSARKPASAIPRPSRTRARTGFTWTYDNLNQFLTDPRKFIPGTKMTFAGLKKEQERADVVAYLRTLADNPAPLPRLPAARQRRGAPAPARQLRRPRPTATPAAPAAPPAPAADSTTAPAPAPAGSSATPRRPRRRTRLRHAGQRTARRHRQPAQ